MTQQQPQRNSRLLVRGTLLIAVPALVGMFSLQKALESGSQFLYTIAGICGLMALCWAAVIARKYKRIPSNE